MYHIDYQAERRTNSMDWFPIYLWHLLDSVESIIVMIHPSSVIAFGVGRYWLFLTRIIDPG